jgi:hypothetical protein
MVKTVAEKIRYRTLRDAFSFYATFLLRKGGIYATRGEKLQAKGAPTLPNALCRK